MTKMPREFKYQRQVHLLSFVVVGLTLCYMVLVGVTVHNTVERQASELAIKSTTAEMSEMEFQYLEAKSHINLELARSRGFVDASNVLIAKKSKDSTAFVGKSI